MRDQVSSRSAFLHLAGAWAIAVVTPLLETLGRSPEFLVAHQAHRLDVLVLVAVLLLVPPTGLWAATRIAAAFHPRLATALLVICLAVLAAAFAAQALKVAGAHATASVVPAAALVPTNRRRISGCHKNSPGTITTATASTDNIVRTNATRA